MKFLGIDFGDKYVGLSLAEEPLNIAFPYKVVENKGKKSLVSQILKIIQEQGVNKVIVGLPYGLSANFTEQTRKTESFVNLLKESIDIPVETFDERLTTKSILQKGEKISHDSSAALILQRWLEKRKFLNKHL
ncbi:Holliday junction resolvase RuvX [bacterium]|nr:Holliday junction resolvase RuvX [bacterium]